MQTHVYSFHKVFDSPLIRGKKNFLATYSGPGYTKEIPTKQLTQLKSKQFFKNSQLNQNPLLQKQ